MQYKPLKDAISQEKVNLDILLSSFSENFKLEDAYPEKIMQDAIRYADNCRS